MNVQMKSGGIAALSLTSALDGGGWSTPRPSAAVPTGKEPGTHYIGGWLGWTGLDRCGFEPRTVQSVPGPTKTLLISFLRLSLDSWQGQGIFIFETGCGARWDSCWIRTGESLFPGVKRQEREDDNWLNWLPLVPGLRMCGVIPPFCNSCEA
jgi:hypothetical protein